MDPSASHTRTQTSAGPRLGFILTAVVLVLFYGLFAASNAHLMRGMWAGPDVLTPTQQLPESDFGLFWCAGKGFIAQAAARWGLAAPSIVWRQTCQMDILAANVPPAYAWPYPPPMGFLVAAFAALPLGVSFWVWRVFSLVLGGWLLRRAGLGWAVIIAGLLSPAALHDMAGGQNGTLTGVMLAASLLLAAANPRRAGVLAGFLALKPQLVLVFPAIIWRRGGARLVLAGAATLALLVVASLAVWGLGPWRWFMLVARPDEILSAARPYAAFFPAAGITVYDMARSFGAGPHLAWACQMGASAAALILVWAGWREGVMQPVPRMAFTVSLALLAMPHGFSYDTVGFSIGMAALFFRAGQWQRFVLALLWLMGGYTITIANYTGLLLFPLWAAAGAGMAWRLRARPDGR